ncbi:aromatic hydrocarbon utilization transcriptional regulator CatR (LysR family) (plasmid) [Sinorhizobium americanum CCGM7]|nr:aromatic hydrocarbon utilization transcriptional regulator CatR (LysR family) [Sinorhizobium americanum CCGM7]
MTEDGVALLEAARPILARLDGLAERFRASQRRRTQIFRIGAIDSAAAGLLPMLLQDFRDVLPDVTTQLFEDKSIRLIPKLLSGGLDLAFIRPRAGMSRNLVVEQLLYETAVVAVPTMHRLAERGNVSVSDLKEQPLIVPDRRSRPHSYDLTLMLFAEAGLHPRISQVADEKQTIVSMVAAGIGLSIVPRWTSTLAASGVRFLPLQGEVGQPMQKLPLAVAWMKAVRDPSRDAMLNLLRRNLTKYAALA